jgi:hypothetical protein
MKKLLISAGLIATFAFAQQYQQPYHEIYLKALQQIKNTKVTYKELNEGLKEAIKHLNKTLPKKVDPLTTLTKAVYLPNTRELVYYGEISNLKPKVVKLLNTKGDAFIKVVKAVLLQNQARLLCTNPNIILFFKYGGKVKYVYTITDKNVKKHYKIVTDIDAQVCKDQKIW